jgi:hypothetical protein
MEIFLIIKEKNTNEKRENKWKMKSLKTLMRPGGVPQAVECLLDNHKVLSLNTSTKNK